MGKLGKWAFIAGLVLAFVSPLFIQVPWFYWVMAVLGLVVGFLNITAEETKGFLLASIGLILSATSVQGIPLIGDLVTFIMFNIVAFIAPAVLVVALKTLFETAKD